MRSTPQGLLMRSTAAPVLMPGCVAKVDELMVLCDQPEQQLNAGGKHSYRLLEAVLPEALVADRRMAAGVPSSR